MLCNTAIFYDIENLLGVFGGKVKTTLNLDEIYRRVLEMEGVHGVSIQRAYADWALMPNRALQDAVLQVGIEPIQIFNSNQNDRVKNAADVSLIIDAVELLSKRPEIENYVIASGDGIFAFLSKKLHEHGKRVIGCGFDRTANVTFRNSCDFYISLEKGDKSLVATTSQRSQRIKGRFDEASATPEVVETVAQPSAPSSKKIPDNFPRSKYSEILAKADIPVWKDANDISGGLITVRKTIEALFSEEAEGLPDLEISVFKTYLMHYFPEFKLSRYRFSGFGTFMQFMLTGSPYCLYTVNGSVFKIARRGTVTPEGTVLEDVRGLVVTAEDGSRYGSIFSVPEGLAFIFTTEASPGGIDKKGGRKKSEPAKNGRRKKASVPVVPVNEEAEVAPIPEPQEFTSELPAIEGVAGDAPKAVEPETVALPRKRGRRKKSEVEASAAVQNKEGSAQTEAASVRPKRGRGRPRKVVPAPEVVETVSDTSTTQENDSIAIDEGSLRRWIKSQFESLSAREVLPESEAKRLTTPEYSRTTFGSRTPIFKEIETRSNLEEQRMANGKVKYWKETFQFNGKHYLVFKDWVAGLHKGRFLAWLKRVE